MYLYSNIYSTVDSFFAVSEGVYVYNQCTIWLKGKFTYVVNNVYEDVDFIPVAWEIVKKPFCVRPNATFGRQLYALVHNVNSILGNLESVILFLLIRLGNPDFLHYSLKEKFGPLSRNRLIVFYSRLKIFYSPHGSCSYVAHLSDSL